MMHTEVAPKRVALKALGVHHDLRNTSWLHSRTYIIAREWKDTITPSILTGLTNPEEA